MKISMSQSKFWKMIYGRLLQISRLINERWYLEIDLRRHTLGAACWWVSTIRPRWESCWIMKPTKFVNLFSETFRPSPMTRSPVLIARGFQVQTFAGAASTKTRCTIRDIEFTLRSRQSRTRNCNCRSMGSNFHSIFWVSEQVCNMQKGLPVSLAAGHGSDAARTFTLKSKLAYSFSRDCIPMPIFASRHVMAQWQIRKYLC